MIIFSNKKVPNIETERREKTKTVEDYVEYLKKNGNSKEVN